MRIKKGDQIKMVAGVDRGKTGKVLAAFPKTGRVVVEGVNIKKKHLRPRKQGQKGELVAMPAAFPISRAALLCGTCGRPVRVVWKRDGARKHRVCKKCGSGI